jgi:hypothetical protein
MLLVYVVKNFENYSRFVQLYMEYGSMQGGGASSFVIFILGTSLHDLRTVLPFNQ